MNNKVKLLILSSLLLVVITTTGCEILQSNQKPVDSKNYKVSGISRSEYQKVRSLIRHGTTLIEPNSVGFIAVSGYIENGSNREIKKVKVVIFNQGDKGPKELVLGEEIVTDIGPGQTKTYNIITSEKSSDLGNFEVKLGDIEF